MKTSTSNVKTKHLCKVCETEIECTPQNFTKHLTKHEITSQQYFDRFFKTETSGKCLTCGNQTKFKSISRGYFDFCSNYCAQVHPSTTLKVKSKLLEKYGEDTYTKTQEYKDKLKTIRTDEWEKNRTDKISETKLEIYKSKYFSDYVYLESREIGDKFKTKEHHLKCSCGTDFWIQNQLVLKRTKAKQKLCTECKLKSPSLKD